MQIPEDIKELQQLVRLLLEEISALKIEVSSLKSEVVVLKVENSELKARLNQNSSNSSKPPSSDYFNRKPAFPKPSNGKKGGQPGHKGGTLHQIVNPDKIIGCIPQDCTCGHNFTNSELFLAEKRQLFDLPVPRLEITEYQIFAGNCPICGKVHKGVSPDNVNSPVQYGNGVRAFTTMLSSTYKLPYVKIQQIFEDLFGYSINESTVFSANKMLSETYSPIPNNFSTLFL